MRISRRSSASPTLLFLSIFGLALLISGVSAQNLPALTGSPATNNAQPPATGEAAPTTTDDSKATTTDAKKTDAKPTDTKNTDTKTTDTKNTDTKTTDTKTTDTKKTTSSVSITDTATTTSSKTQASVPTITGGSSAAGLPKDLPTLAGQYPAPSVPPTQNAPFMKHSNLPEGTVFIIVGAALGFFGLSVLVWRGLVAWSLKRSVQRAAMQQNVVDSKPLLRPNKGGFYNTRPGSTLSLDHLTPSGRPVPGGGKNPTPNSSLFFSPTARPGSVLDAPGNRTSAYLPAGYYAAGNSAPGGAAGVTHAPGGSISGGIGLSNLGPQSQGYSRARTSMAVSPPGSPALSPMRPEYARRSSQPLVNSNLSTSSLNLNQNQAPQVRAPSAYLEDLFDHRVDQGHGAGPR